MNHPLLCTEVARKRVVEEIMALHGRSLRLEARTEYRRQLEAMSLDELARIRDDLLGGP